LAKAIKGIDKMGRTIINSQFGILIFYTFESFLIKESYHPPK
jgi:hypothetical protein